MFDAQQKKYNIQHITYAPALKNNKNKYYKRADVVFSFICRVRMCPGLSIVYGWNNKVIEDKQRLQNLN